MGRTIQIQATEPQSQFHNLSCKYPAFVGGFGVGKSQTLANQAIMDASHSATALIACYEPTYDLVRLILAPRLEERLAEFGVAYKYNKSENIIYTSSGQFGDFVLRTLDNPARIVGYESYRAHIDEIDTLKMDHAQEAWIKIIARNRQAPDGIPDNLKQWNNDKQRYDPFNRASVYSTPEGFRFLHKRWVTEANEHYQLVKASTLTNPFLPADYVDSLRASYPAELINAYINGDFVNLTHGTVYRSYDRNKHRSTETVKPGEPLLVGMDFNIDNMAATVYVLRDRAYHAVDQISKGYNTPEVAQALRNRYPEHEIIIYPDSSGKNRTRSGRGVAESDIATLSGLIEDGGFGFECRYHNTNPAVKDRINATNKAFEDGLLFVNDAACPDVAACFEQQTYNDLGEPDKKGGKDHQNDASTYPIAYELPISKPVHSINISWNS